MYGQRNAAQVVKYRIIQQLHGTAAVAIRYKLCPKPSLWAFIVYCAVRGLGCSERGHNYDVTLGCWMDFLGASAQLFLATVRFVLDDNAAKARIDP